MLTPRYFFHDDFSELAGYFESRPHVRRQIRRGDYLWLPGEPFARIHFILSGVAQNYIEHENGRRRILSFHGRGTVFPGYHGRDYRIERSIVTRAVSEMEVLEFTRAQFAAMFEENAALRRIQLDWYATYVNLLLYDAAHQEFNSARIQLCNLLYLLQGGEADPQRLPDVTQDELSDILGMSRVNLARTLAQLREEVILRTQRRRIEILDPAGLRASCSLETLDDGAPPEYCAYSKPFSGGCL